MTRDLDQLPADYRTAAAALTTYRGSLRRLRPITLDRNAASDAETLKRENEAIRRLPHAELNRIQLEIRAEHESIRRAAAGIARKDAEQVRDIVAHARAAVAAARRNVLLSPSKADAFNHFRPGDMLTAELLRLQLEKRYRAAGLGELLAVYAAALERDDAKAALDMELIEAMSARGELLAADDEGRKARRALALMIEEEQAMRVPADLPDFDALEDQLSKLDVRADAIQVLPLDPDRDLAAGAAYEQTLEAMNEAGEATDADDQAALRETFQS